MKNKTTPMTKNLNDLFHQTKRLSAKEKDDILKSGKDLLLYEYLEEVAVRITPDGRCYLKYPEEPEHEVDYEKSEIAGNGYVYGIPISEKDYNNY